jgi:hypothetical protein
LNTESSSNTRRLYVTIWSHVNPVAEMSALAEWSAG